MSPAQLQRALEALRPFAEAYALYKRNGYLPGLDLIVRQNGNILGHAGIQAPELKKAYAVFTEFGGKVED